MKKPWTITNFLKELQDGFYVDINPESDELSPTKLLDSQYRWRGIAITPTPIEFSRSTMFKNFVIDLKENPNGMVESLYSIHPGTMLHYVRFNRVDNICEILQKTYQEDVEKMYANTKIYPHLNIVTMEIVGQINGAMRDQIYDQFDIKLVYEENDSHWFVNDVLSYLI